MAELQNCQAEGKIRHIGACNLSIDNLQACLGVGRLESLQVPFSLAEQQHRPALEYAVSSQMTTLGYNILAHGFFTGKFGSQSTFSGTDLRGRIPLLTEGNRGRVFALLERIRAASTITGLTPAQVAIGWALAQSALNVVLVGARSAQQVEESAGQVDTALSAEALTLLDG
jgi:aryl-alcohol dehydrogenase-like predicted oxidoreductase